MAARKARPVEQVKASGIAAIMTGEASYFVPLSSHTLLRRYHEGRLIAGGNPLTVEIEHLKQQHLRDFPPVDQSGAAA